MEFSEATSNTIIATETDEQEQYSRWYNCEQLEFDKAWQAPENPFDFSGLFSEDMTFSATFSMSPSGLSGSNTFVIAPIPKGDLKNVYLLADEDDSCYSATGSEFGDDNAMEYGEVTSANLDSFLFYICRQFEWLTTDFGYTLEIYRLDSYGSRQERTYASPSSGYGFRSSDDARYSTKKSIEADDLLLDTESYSDLNGVTHSYEVVAGLYDSSDSYNQLDQIVVTFSAKFGDEAVVVGGEEPEESSGSIKFVASLNSHCSGYSQCASAYSSSGYSLTSSEENDIVYICAFSNDYSFSNLALGFTVYGVGSEVFRSGSAESTSVSGLWSSCWGYYPYNSYNSWSNQQSPFTHVVTVTAGSDSFSNNVEMTYDYPAPVVYLVASTEGSCSSLSECEGRYSSSGYDLSITSADDYIYICAYTTNYQTGGQNTQFLVLGVGSELLISSDVAAGSTSSGWMRCFLYTAYSVYTNWDNKQSPFTHTIQYTIGSDVISNTMTVTYDVPNDPVYMYISTTPSASNSGRACASFTECDSVYSSSGYSGTLDTSDYGAYLYTCVWTYNYPIDNLGVEMILYGDYDSGEVVYRSGVDIKNRGNGWLSCSRFTLAYYYYYWPNQQSPFTHRMDYVVDGQVVSSNSITMTYY